MKNRARARRRRENDRKDTERKRRGCRIWDLYILLSQIFAFFLIYSFYRYQISRIKRSKIKYRIRIPISEYSYPRTRFHGESIHVAYNNALSENRAKSVYRRLSNFGRASTIPWIFSLSQFYMLPTRYRLYDRYIRYDFISNPKFVNSSVNSW
jgi:hypothetical protein